MMSGLLLLLLLQAAAAVPRDVVTLTQDLIQKEDNSQVHSKVYTSLDVAGQSYLENTVDDDDASNDESKISPLLDALEGPKSRVKRGDKVDKADDALHLTRVKRKSAKKAAKKLATAYVNNKMKKKKKGGFMKVMIVVAILAAIAIGAVAFCIIKVKSMYTSI